MNQIWSYIKLIGVIGVIKGDIYPIQKIYSNTCWTKVLLIQARPAGSTWTQKIYGLLGLLGLLWAAGTYMVESTATVIPTQQIELTTPLTIVAPQLNQPYNNPHKSKGPANMNKSHRKVTQPNTSKKIDNFLKKLTFFRFVSCCSAAILFKVRDRNKQVRARLVRMVANTLPNSLEP